MLTKRQKLHLFSLALCLSNQYLSSNARHVNIVRHEEHRLERIALKKLELSLEAYENGGELMGSTVFEDLIPAYAVPDAFVHASNGRGESSKYFVGINTISSVGRDFIVYGAGIDNNPVFERQLASLNASVFAFDCTNVAKDDWKEFTFYPWCIGRKKEMNSIYTANSADKTFQFYSIHTIKEKLQHDHIDMLKFDIEGFEWDLFVDEILKADSDDLPTQLLFELHTEGASAFFVSPNVVKGFGRRQVTQLIYNLFFRNYRLLSLEINNNGRGRGDLHCAEIMLLRIDQSDMPMTNYRNFSTIFPDNN